jgi:hypothetical protein
VKRIQIRFISLISENFLKRNGLTLVVLDSIYRQYPNPISVYRRLGLPEEDAESRDLSLLCKVAKGGCLDKTTFLLDQIMAARQGPFGHVTRKEQWGTVNASNL